MCSLISVFLPLFVFISKKHHIYSDAWFPIQRLGVAIDIYQVLNNLFESSPAPFAPYIFKKIHKKTWKDGVTTSLPFAAGLHVIEQIVVWQWKKKKVEGIKSSFIVQCLMLESVLSVPHLISFSPHRNFESWACDYYFYRLRNR